MVLISDTSLSANGIITPSSLVEDYEKLSIQISGEFNASISIQVSNDNTNFSVYKLESLSTNNRIMSSIVKGSTVNYFDTTPDEITAKGNFTVPVSYRYIRLIVSNYVSGTISALIYGVSASSGGGGGGGDASASNQSTQITAANLTNTKLDEIKVKQDTQITTLGTLNTKTPALGQAAMAASQPVVIASDQSNLAVIPLMASGGNVSATTAATGTNWTAYSSQVCKQCTLSNQTGTTIEVRQGAAGVGLQIPTGAFYTFFGITNTNQLDIRRVDTSNTQVTVTARWEA